MRAARLTNDAIRRAAIERLGCADAMVSRYRDMQKAIYIDNHGGQLDCGGEWYVLALQRQRGAAFEVVARRRTRGELLAALGKGRRN